MLKSIDKPVVVIPNLNGGIDLQAATSSLLSQTLQPHIIIVDNASTDSSTDFLKDHPDIELIQNTRNEGYAGGVNPGLERAIAMGAEYVGPFNDDAVADMHWLENLVAFLEAHPTYGAATPKVMKDDKKHLDSTGDYYTNWGLAYPRGRDEIDTGQYDDKTEIFAASGAACIYRVAALKEVGLLDESFFAYYEDVDLSFRLQWAGWKIAFVPGAVVYHKIGMTSDRVKGFATYQTMKNTPLLFAKNVPSKYWWRMGWRFMLARVLFFGRAVTRGHGWAALKGDAAASWLLVKKRAERKRIQRNKKVSDEYIWRLMTHDLPPNAHNLRKLRAAWWKLTRKKVA